MSRAILFLTRALLHFVEVYLVLVARLAFIYRVPPSHAVNLAGCGIALMVD